MALVSRPIRYLQTQDGKTHTGLYSKGEFTITPAGLPLLAQWDGTEDYLQIRLDREFVKSIARETFKEECDQLKFVPEFRTRNPHIEAIGMMLLSELQQGSTENGLYMDSIANILAVNLLKTHGTLHPHLSTYAGGLPQHQLRQIFEYIDAHLGQDITLADLARLLDMSQFHFSHLFKQSVGLSPYQYLLQQRVERAKLLLKQSDLLIVDIALECGFSSHSHLTKQFRKQTRMTPKAYRSSQSRSG